EARLPEPVSGDRILDGAVVLDDDPRLTFAVDYATAQAGCAREGCRHRPVQEAAAGVGDRHLIAAISLLINGQLEGGRADLDLRRVGGRADDRDVVHVAVHRARAVLDRAALGRDRGLLDGDLVAVAR